MLPTYSGIEVTRTNSLWPLTLHFLYCMVSSQFEYFRTIRAGRRSVLPILQASSSARHVCKMGGRMEKAKHEKILSST